jgi:hypothetical protein
MKDKSVQDTSAAATNRTAFIKLFGPSGVDLSNYRRGSWIAGKLGITPRTVRRWYERGLVSQFKLNSRVILYNLDEVVHLLEEGRIKANTPIEQAKVNITTEGRA